MLKPKPWMFIEQRISLQKLKTGKHANTQTHTHTHTYCAQSFTQKAILKKRPAAIQRTSACKLEIILHFWSLTLLSSPFRKLKHDLLGAPPIILWVDRKDPTYYLCRFGHISFAWAWQSTEVCSRHNQCNVCFEAVQSSALGPDWKGDFSAFLPSSPHTLTHHTQTLHATP